MSGYESHTHGSTNHCGHGCHDFIQQTHVKISPRTGGCEPQLNDVRIRESWVFSENQGDFCLKKRVVMIARPKQVSTEAYSSGEWSMVQPFLTSHFLTEEYLYISFFMMLLSELTFPSINLPSQLQYHSLGNSETMAGSPFISVWKFPWCWSLLLFSICS